MKYAHVFEDFENLPVLYATDYANKLTMEPADRPLLDPDLREQLVAYCKAAMTPLTYRHVKRNMMNPKGAVLDNPQTDGVWWWHDAMVEYMERYSLSPQPEFVEHCRTQNFVTPILTVDEALACLGMSPSSEPPETRRA